MLFNIANIWIKSWNDNFYLALDCSNAAGTIWWLKQSIIPCKVNESVVAIANKCCVYLLTCVWMFCSLKVQKFNLSSTLALSYTKATWSRVGLVGLLFKSWFYVWHVVETYIKGTFWKGCYLVTSSRLIHQYFII